MLITVKEILNNFKSSLSLSNQRRWQAISCDTGSEKDTPEHSCHRFLATGSHSQKAAGLQSSGTLALCFPSSTTSEVPFATRKAWLQCPSLMEFHRAQLGCVHRAAPMHWERDATGKSQGQLCVLCTFRARTVRRQTAVSYRECGCRMLWKGVDEISK